MREEGKALGAACCPDDLWFRAVKLIGCTNIMRKFDTRKFDSKS
jgi:hypothetical protein